MITNAGIASAQTWAGLFDENVAEICGWIKTLKDEREGYKVVRKEMAGKQYWRLMEECYENCIDKDSMCDLWDAVDMTGINDDAFQAEKDRGTRPQSTDNFCAGNETRYLYSFYECRVKAGAVVSTVLGQRSGAQLFAFIPYDEFDAIEIKVQLVKAGSQTEYEIPGCRTADGYMIFYSDEAVTPSDIIRIDISNMSGSNQSVVLVNHNSCK